MRLIGLDYGSRTVGVAATDALGLTVQPLGTLWRKEEGQLRKTLRRIEEIAAERKAEAFVVGYPVNMDGSAGERAGKAAAFAKTLRRRTGLPVYLMDERLTTVEADGILEETGKDPEERKSLIDQVAACLILEDYIGAGGTGACEIKE